MLLFRSRRSTTAATRWPSNVDCDCRNGSFECGTVRHTSGIIREYHGRVLNPSDEWRPNRPKSIPVLTCD